MDHKKRARSVFKYGPEGVLFTTSGHHFSLLNMFHGWSKHFTSRYDPSTPFPFPFTPTPFPFTP